MARSRFSFRALVSVILFWTFLALIFSGVILFIAPKGRIAHWTDWQLLALDKGQWQGVHTLMALLFLVGGLFHLLKFNRRTIWTYVRRSREERSPFRWAVVTSSLLFLAVLAGTVAGVPPLSSVMDISERLTNGWDVPTSIPPVPHMEEFTLGRVAERSGLDADAACAKLRESGLQCEDPESTLLDIAAANGTSPAELYQVLNPSPGPGRFAGAAAEHGDRPTGQGRGAGWGRMTVEQAAPQLSVPVAKAIERLRVQGIAARPEDSLRELAQRHGVRPADVADLIRPSATSDREP